MIRVFLSWSNELTGYVADQFCQRLRAVLGGKVDPFLSRHMLPSSQPMLQMLNALRDSNHALVFLTRDALNPPWVIFEAGAVGKDPDQSMVTPVTIGFPPGDIEPPLQIMRQGVSIGDEDRIRQLFASICNAAGGDHTLLNQGFTEWFKTLQAGVQQRLLGDLSGGTDWKLVKPAKLAEVTRGSPFEAKDAFRLATQRLVFVGQNLFGLVGRGGPIKDCWFWGESRKFLKGTRESDTQGQSTPANRKLDILVIDPMEPHLKEAWGRSIGDQAGFEKHLAVCISALGELKQVAKSEGLDGQVRVKLAKFIPLTSTFIDPDDPNRGVLFLRPFTREDRPHHRPIMLITRRDNPGAFEFYWTRHDADYEGGLYTKEL